MNYLLGLGNYSMFDDSIGLRIVEYISQRNLDKGFGAIDLSGNLLNLLSYFNSDTEKILLVDCARIDLTPGDYLFFTPEAVQTEKEEARFSTHEEDLPKILELAKVTGYPIPLIEVMAIQPEMIRPEFGLSQVLSRRLPEYAAAAIFRLAPVKNQK